MKRTKGFTLVELLVVVAIIALLVSILLPTLGKAKELAKRAICGANLKSIGNSLVIYMAESDDQPPWLESGDWGTVTGTGGSTAAQPANLSPTALMFLIVRSGQTADLFRCPSDEDSKKMAKTKSGDNYYWDFCDTDSPQPGGRDCDRVSYSYQAPLYDSTGTSYSSGYTGNSSGGLAVMADKTPGGSLCNWSIDDSATNKYSDGMSPNHSSGAFINVLFADGHAKGGERADVGIGNDNIYSSSGTDAGSQTSTTTTVPPTNHLHEEDSFLIGPIESP